jgi:hypothetical protein
MLWRGPEVNREKERQAKSGMEREIGRAIRLNLNLTTLRLRNL